MIAFPDTSFLCALYVRQDNSSRAAAYFQKMPEPLSVSGLLLYEFRQSIRFPYGCLRGMAGKAIPSPWASRRWLIMGVVLVPTAAGRT